MHKIIFHAIDLSSTTDLYTHFYFASTHAISMSFIRFASIVVHSCWCSLSLSLDYMETKLGHKCNLYTVTTCLIKRNELRDFYIVTEFCIINRKKKFENYNMCWRFGSNALQNQNSLRSMQKNEFAYNCTQIRTHSHCWMNKSETVND